MAINPTPPESPEPQMRDFWPHYHKTAIWITTLMEIVATLVIGLSLLVGGVDADSSAFWITMFATIIATGLLNYILVDFLLTPLRDLAIAITSVAGQKTTGPLANPNTPRYSSNGFKPLLQYLYDKSAAEHVAPSPHEPPSHALGEKLETALRETKTGVVIMDSRGSIQYANHAAPVRRNTKGDTELELLFDHEGSLEKWLQSCQDSAVHAEQTWLRVPNRAVGDEDRRIFNVTANYEKGSVAEVVLVAFDATDIYQPEDDDLDFIAFAAHELRGPITVIKGYLDVLDTELEGTIADDQRELFKRLIVSANRLSGYINNILNTSKYDRRHLQIHLSEESLADIYDSIRDDMELRAQSQRRLLSVTLPQDLPTVAADRSSLSEVFSNLIDNALKYSNDGGSVAVTAEVEGDFVKVTVVDNGIGIPASVIGNLFHKFYRSHRSRESVAGTGIGLYICKAIVESHGGTIGVSSIEGQGATFSFTVPIYASVAAKLQANDFTNAGLITSSNGWIKNHSKYSE